METTPKWYPKKERKKIEIWPRLKGPRSCGYLYLFHMEGTPYYKIGATADDVGKRLRTIQVCNPFKIVIVHTRQCDNMHVVEKFMHAKFCDKNPSGEWFTLTPEDIEFIKSY